MTVIKNSNIHFVRVCLFQVFVFGLFFLGVNIASAAEVYLSTHGQDIYIDDVFIVDARISSPDTLINVADGSIVYDQEKLEVRELSTGGSAFSLWASGPSFSNLDGKVRFVGGTPKGFQGDGLIVRTIFTAKKAGKTNISIEDGFSLFLSDGKGTKIVPRERFFEAITIIERPKELSPRDEWKDFVGRDVHSPEFAEAVISKDPRIFDGKYFLSFFATDEGTGVLYYEVKEGEREYIRSNSPYVLQDQTLKSTVLVKAVDVAGNEAVITPEISAPQEVPMTKYPIWIFVLVIVALILIVLRGKIKNKA